MIELGNVVDLGHLVFEIDANSLERTVEWYLHFLCGLALLLVSLLLEFLQLMVEEVEGFGVRGLLALHELLSLVKGGL